MRDLRLARAYSVEEACDGKGCIIGDPFQEPRPPVFEEFLKAETALVEFLTFLTQVNIQHSLLER